MKAPKKVYVILIIVLGTALYFGCSPSNGNSTNNVTNKDTAVSAMSDSVFLATQGSLAMNDPDNFNWIIFSMICKSAPTQSEVGANKTKTNDAIWETWADDTYHVSCKPESSKSSYLSGSGPAA